MGFLRGFYGLSTATDVFTGFLRIKTWFLSIGPKSDQEAPISLLNLNEASMKASPECVIL